MANNKVYTAVIDFLCPAGTHGFPFFFESNLRNLKIKSILLDVNLEHTSAAGTVYYNSHNYPTAQNFILSVGNNVLGGTSNKFATALIFPAAPGLTVYNTGDYFELSQAGQYHFDSFFIDQRLDFTFTATNLTAADLFRYFISLAIETEEQINYI